MIRQAIFKKTKVYPSVKIPFVSDHLIHNTKYFLMEVGHVQLFQILDKNFPLILEC